MVANVAGMYGMYPNIYNNQIALNDLSGMDLYYPTGMCMDPMLSMNGSLFGGMMPGITPGVNPMMPMMPPGYMPSFGGNTGTGNSYEDYYKQLEKYQDFMIDSQVRQQQKMRDADLRLSGPVEGIQEKATLLKDKIIRNEQQQIKQSYDSFVESVKQMYGDNASEEQIRNRANALYKQATGKELMEDIREHGRDSFTQGLVQSLTFGLFNRQTAEETVSSITGQPVGSEENAKKIAGSVAGGAIVGGSAFALSGVALSAAKVASKSKTFWGIVAGGVLGAIAAIAGTSSK